MADKDKSDDTTNAATGTSSDRPPVTATPTPPLAVATPTTVTATPTHDTLDAPSTSRTRKADTPPSDADLPYKRPSISGDSASVAKRPASLPVEEEFFDLMDTSEDPDTREEGAACEVEPWSSEQSPDDISTSSASTVIFCESKVKIRAAHPVFDCVRYTRINGKDTEDKEIDYPLPDTTDVIEPYLYENRVCILKVENLNGNLFHVFYDAEGRVDLSLPLFEHLLSRGLKPSGIPQVNECATVRVSSCNGVMCFLQRIPLYADMIGYMLYAKAKISEINAQPVTNPTLRKLYAYIDDATSQYYRVKVHEDTPSDKAKSEPEKHSKDDKTISLKCVDYGIIIRAEKSKIFALEDVYPALSVIPHQAFEAVAFSVYNHTENIERKLKKLRLDKRVVRMKTKSFSSDGTPTVELGLYEDDPDLTE